MILNFTFREYIKGVNKIKTIEALKARELKLARCISKLLALVNCIQNKVNAWSKRSIEKLKNDLVKQQQIRDDQLALLALEQDRIKAEIAEIEEAIVKHGNYLEKF